MIMSNTTSSWVQTWYPRLDSNQTAQKETWNGLISPSHFVHLEVWIQTNSTPWNTCFTSNSKTRSLVKIDSKALQQRFWTPRIKRLSKEDNTVCWISNSRQLNKVMRYKEHPLPIITDVLCKCSGYKFFTKLDVSMQYYTFELDNKSQDSRTIITPFDKHKYLRLPMGLKCSPDIAQANVGIWILMILWSHV